MAHINSDILRLGVDVGSTTVKAVALDPADNSVLFTRYQRHNAHQADTVRQLLEETTGLPVVLWDERRTTIDAHQILMSSGKNAKKRKKVVDAVAASLILEGYLTYLKTHPEG